MKRIIAVIMSVMMLVGLCACGAEKKIEGDLLTVVQNMYAEVEQKDDVKEAFMNHMIDVVPEDADMQAFLLGSSDLEYAEAVYAMPMMNAIAYQLNMFRVAEGTDVKAFMEKAESSFDTGKWVCVMPEKVATVNVGDVVMYIAGTEQVVDAMVAAFQAQGK